MLVETGNSATQNESVHNGLNCSLRPSKDFTNETLDMKSAPTEEKQFEEYRRGSMFSKQSFTSSKKSSFISASMVSDRKGKKKIAINNN
mmetsp:Transcript_32190/g.36712  ORF Transcript_32190/g.36712 Transcript_32190/m.36712 type:complete len:89 (+) Transcript_32190:299-565(+)